MWPFTLVEDAINGLYMWLTMLAALVLYFPEVIFVAVYNTLVDEVNLLIDFVNCPITLVNFILDNLFSMFENVFPQEAISYLLVAQISIVLMFRVYHYVKGISIAGFSIGG